MMTIPMLIRLRKGVCEEDSVVWVASQKRRESNMPNGICVDFAFTSQFFWPLSTRLMQWRLLPSKPTAPSSQSIISSSPPYVLFCLLYQQQNPSLWCGYMYYLHWCCQIHLYFVAVNDLSWSEKMKSFFFNFFSILFA